MTTHQEALEAARAAYQSAIPVRPWRADGGETDAPIRAAVAAYLTTLAPADNGLVEWLREAQSDWLGLNDDENAEMVGRAADTLTALQADRTAQASEIEQLKAEVTLSQAQTLREMERLAALEALLDKAVEALVPFARIAEAEDFADTKDGESIFVNVSLCRAARSTLTAIQEARHGASI